MVQANLRRRAPDGHQIAGAVGIPGNHRSLRRDSGWGACRRLAPAGTQHRNPDLERIHPAHRLEIQLILALDPYAAAIFGPNLRPSKKMR